MKQCIKTFFRVFIWLLIVIFPLYSHGQERADSLILLLDTISNDQKPRIYNELADEFLDTDPARAADYANQALMRSEKLQNLLQKSEALQRLGEAYFYLDSKDKALQYFKEFLQVSIEINDSMQIAAAYNNLGIMYRHCDSSLVALEYYKKALEIRRIIKYSKGIASSLNNIGVLYDIMQQYDTALVYYTQALQMDYEQDNMQGVGIYLLNIGDVYRKKQDYGTAEKYFLRALTSSDSANDLLNVRDINHALYLLYKEQKRYDASLACYEKYTHINDSVMNEENINAAAELDVKYQTFKRKKELDEQRQKIQNQRKAIIAISVVVLLIGAFLFFLWRLYKQKQAAHKQLTEKQRLITDSIRYAARIQSALLPSLKDFDDGFDEYFVLFRPREIVSGDFYWVKRYKNKHIVVIADCTGHGVPGAFMSVLGIAALNETMLHQEIVENEQPAAAILNHLRDTVIKSLHQNGESETSDGMDMTLCIFDLENRLVHFAGAYNSLLMVRDQQPIMYKGDKMPVGKHLRKEQGFKNHAIEVNTGDKIYLYTDGFADQVGGDKKNKFLSRNFNNLLVETSNLPMREQMNQLDHTLDLWMKDYKQVDDILVAGFTIVLSEPEYYV